MYQFVGLHVYRPMWFVMRHIVPLLAAMIFVAFPVFDFRVKNRASFIIR
jgi:hypothetical protein